MKYFNNPGNLRYAVRNKWKGQTIPRNGFCQFTDMKYGLRALMITLRTYFRRGITSVDRVIATYAPPIENQTDVYIKSVLSMSAFLREHRYTLSSSKKRSICELTRCICQMETGSYMSHIYLESLYNEFKL